MIYIHFLDPIYHGMLEELVSNEIDIKHIRSHGFGFNSGPIHTKIVKSPVPDL